MARQIEGEFSHVQQLILLGKERGYLLYDEVNDSLPAEVNSSQENLDDFADCGIDLIDPWRF